MSFINIEIKARCSNPENIEQILLDENANFKGLDHQIDTYFNVPKGRLKLREGNIENSLIFYERENISGPKKSQVQLYKTQSESGLKEVLYHSLGINIIVDKKRKIFFIENIKFHIDEVKGLGSFVEIEAIDKHGTIGQTKLEAQCDRYIKKFAIDNNELISVSYSDLLLNNNISEIED